MLLRFAFVLCSALIAAPALADAIGDCEKHGLSSYRKNGSTISKIEIDKGPSLVVNRYDGKVGSQFVSTEYTGFAQFVAASGTKRQRFVCLHAGNNRAVYFTLISE